MTTCMHGCGRPAAPRTGSRGCAPRSCSDCQRTRKLDRDRELRARWRAADPELYRLIRRVKRERQRAEVAA